MLEVDVQKKLGSFSINVAFLVRAPGITALFGPSGAGKTSIINMVAGLLKPDQGQISVTAILFLIHGGGLTSLLTGGAWGTCFRTDDFFHTCL